MFRPDQVGCVNRDAVGEYPAGTLLVTWADEVKHRAIPWNHFPHPDGGYVPLVDAAGQPVYPLTDVIDEQLQGAHVQPDPDAADPTHVVE